MKTRWLVAFDNNLWTATHSKISSGFPTLIATEQDIDHGTWGVISDCKDGVFVRYKNEAVTTLEEYL